MQFIFLRSISYLELKPTISWNLKVAVGLHEEWDIPAVYQIVGPDTDPEKEMQKMKTQVFACSFFPKSNI